MSGIKPRLRGALEGIYARVPLGMRLGLEPMRAACARAGHPERSFEIVHVAGTNGKGSTCAMVEASVRAAGRKTGLYTSPQLIRFAERIRIGGEPIGDDVLTSVLEEALTIGADLSFFETVTLAAFLAFRERGVDLAVIEVGLGGRLDATNIVERPRVSAITGIALDHMDRLGDTLDAIAREKAAIAKAGVPMVLGPLPAEARAAVIDVASRAGARIVEAEELPGHVAVGLAGPHQRVNGGVAWSIAAELGIDESARIVGLASARWPGRLERIESKEAELAGTWILDGAHNPDGAHALVLALQLEEERIGALVFGALADKSWREMLEVLGALDAPRIYVAPSGREPVAPELLAATASGTSASSLDDALRLAVRTSGDAPIVVCGSLYLVGAVRGRLLGIEPDPIVAL